MFFTGKSIFIRYQAIRPQHEPMVHVGEKALIFTIDNLSENAIVSVSSAAELLPADLHWFAGNLTAPPSS